jgi:hypothetical protein
LARFRVSDEWAQKNPLAWFGERVGETWFLDRYQPNAPRFRVVVVIIMVVIIMPRGIAALKSARLPVLVSRLSMGSQKCTEATGGSTCKGADATI